MPPAKSTVSFLRREIGEGAVEVVGDGLDSGAPDPCAAALGVVSRGTERSLEGLQGFRSFAEVEKDVAPQAAQGGAVGGLAGELEPARGELLSRLVAIFGHLGTRGGEVGLWRLRVLGAVKVHGTERRITRSEPMGRPLVQLAPPAFQETAVDRIVDEGVCEQEAVCLWPYHELRADRIGDVVRPAEQKGQRVPVETLAEYGRHHWTFRHSAVSAGTEQNGSHTIKKWAAAAALLAAAFYLVLSGAEVATQRAFIMTAIVLLGVMLDRQALTLRMLAVAALAVMMATPEAVVHPSLQMSFAATLALVAAREGQGGVCCHSQDWRTSQLYRTHHLSRNNPRRGQDSRDLFRQARRGRSS